MPMSDPTDILLTHDRWATRNVLDACGTLDHDAFHKRFDMGVGSLHDTTTHILGAMRGWGDLLAGREQRERLEVAGPYEPTALLELLDEIGADLLKHAKAHPVNEIVTGERGGKSWSFTRGGVITHVTTHGMHHRAQCLNMLRQLDVEPLPPTAVVEWMLMVDPVG